MFFLLTFVKVIKLYWNIVWCILTDGFIGGKSGIFFGQYQKEEIAL
jgi:hypothetical protein